MVVSTIRPNQTFGCMGLLCVSLSFASCSGRFVVHPPAILLDTGTREGPKTVAATMLPPPPLSPRVFVS